MGRDTRPPVLGPYPALHPTVLPTLQHIHTARTRLHAAFRDLDSATGTAVDQADQVVEQRQRELHRLYEQLNRQHHAGLHTLTDAQVMTLTRPSSPRPSVGRR